MSEINITPFDNEISILHKWARYFQIPIRLIIIKTKIRGDKEETIYTNSVQEIQNLSQDKLTLEDIEKELIEYLETEDIVMIYFLSKQQDPSLLSEINRLYQQKGIEPIQDFPELLLMLSDWRNNVKKDLDNDMLNLENLDIIHEELGKYSEVLYSPIKVDQVTIKASPSLKTGIKPNVDDGLIIFNQSVPSYDVPFIRYNGSSGTKTELFKLYRGRTDEEMPNFKIIIPPSSQSNKDDSVYFTVWSGKGDVNNAIKESYLKGFYNIPKNLLTIKTPNEEDINQETIIKKMEQAFPISIKDVTETGISGEFFMFDLDINDIYLVDMVVNTELMNSYLFVKETNTPYAEKKQLKIYYKSFRGFVEEEEKVAEGYIVNPSSVTVSITQNRASGGEIVNVIMGDETKKFRLTHGLPYIRAKITQAESLDAANQFVKIFSRLMQYYKKEKGNIERLYSGFIPELTQTSEREIRITVKQSTGKKGAGDSKIERLKEVAPDLFVHGYARKCQCVFQPIAIPPDEIQSWQDNTFMYKDVLRKRQVMSFPPDNPKWNFVCPNDSAPFPGVKMNKDLENKDIYPCVPCCFKDDQMDPASNSNYNECFRGKPKKPDQAVEGAKDTHKIKTDKILDPGRYGYLPKNITDLLMKYSDKAIDMVRMGVPHSVNSLLHCLSVALQDTIYSSLNYEQKEVYVGNLRRTIVSQTLPNLIKQEMYDFSDTEILDQLSDQTLFLDPNLFYRAIENAYNINLYVFQPPNRDDSNSLGSFAMPRFKLFHARSPRPEKRSVLIFRTLGAESDSLKYPQCELIVDRDETNNRNINSFGGDMDTLLHNALVKLNRTVTWELVQERNIVARENIYSRVNYFYMLNKLPNKQIIDGYGKVQAFIFTIRESEMTVIIPSTQPENLPTGTVTRVNIDLPIGIFGEPKAVTKFNDKVDGVWYQVLDLEFGLYVPVNPTDRYQDLKEGPSNPLVEEGTEVIQRLRKLKRDLDIITQTVIWLFLLSKMNISDFANKYIAIGNISGGDSSKIYNFSGLGLKFPMVATVEEGIKALKEIAPSLIHDDKVFLYSQKFFDGIIYHLEKYNKERKPRDSKIPSVIHYSDITEEDFIHSRRTAVFIGESDMRTWLNSLDKLSFKNIIIENELNISNGLRIEPYLYNAPTGNIYVIQNVVGGDKLRAINVAYNWYVNKINSGHSSDPFKDVNNVPIFVVYGISPALSPVVIENHAGDSIQYLQLLSYGKDQFAAMLPLL